MTIAVECVVRGADRLGECALWDDQAGVLWWIDIRKPALKRFDPGRSDIRVRVLPETIGSFGLRAGAGMVAGFQSGLYRLDPDTGAREAIAQPEKHLPENRFNDGRCDR